MKLIDVNWYELKHDQVCKHMEGALSYKNTFFINKLQKPCAVYYAASPNREKDHKDYVLIFSNYDPISKKSNMFVSGLNKEEMEKERYQDGVYCPHCKEVIYSMYRHDYRECSCKKCFIDGGKDYTRSGIEGQIVKIDLIERTVKL